VLKLILQVLLAILVFRLIGSLFGMFRRGGKGREAFERGRESQAVDNPEYKDLTPYDIEDADYEDLPKQD